MNRIAGRSIVTLILALVLVAGFGFFVAEFVTEADQWAISSGAPHVYEGDSINCGIVLDRDNILLADLQGEREYTQSVSLRKSTVHWLGDRYGNISAPIFPYYAKQIAGYDLVGGVYSYGNSAGIVELTLSGKVQQAALEAMGSYKGTVAVVNYQTGEILCAVTTPTYDPDSPPDLSQDTTGAYEGLYLNRFTQSTYIPGSIYKIVTLAAALETIPDIQERSFTCTGSYEVQGEQITCESAHGQQDLKGAFCNSCNCAFAQIAIELGGETLAQYAQQFGITDRITFDGITTAAGNFEASDALLNVAWSGVGQYNDQINPCAYLTFISAVAAGGKGTNPYVVEKITVAGSKTYGAVTENRERILSENTAKILQEYMRNNVRTYYGDGNFSGLTVCAKTGTAQVGGDQRPNAMLTGFCTDEKYPLAFIICVEDAGYGSTVCIPIASKVLAECKSVLE